MECADDYTSFIKINYFNKNHLELNLEFYGLNMECCSPLLTNFPQDETLYKKGNKQFDSFKITKNELLSQLIDNIKELDSRLTEAHCQALF